MGCTTCFCCCTWWTRRARPEPQAPIAPATSATSTTASDDSSSQDSSAPEQTAAAQRFVDERRKQKQKEKKWKQEAEEQQRRQADEKRQQAEEQQQRLQDQQQEQAADEERLRELLEGLGFSSYADAIVAHGYDSAERIGAMTKAEVNELADVVGMEPVHKKKFTFFMVQRDSDGDEGESSGTEEGAKAALPADAPPVVVGTAPAALATSQPIAGSAVPVLDPEGGPLAC